MLKKKKELGITLIALVVTIIILLILAGVTLNMALSQNGLFSRAQNAADKYKKAQEDEEGMLNEMSKQFENFTDNSQTENLDYSKYVGAIVTGYNPESKECSIETVTSGTDKIQKFTTDSNMPWRIWDYDGRV